MCAKNTHNTKSTQVTYNFQNTKGALGTLNYLPNILNTKYPAIIT